MNNPSFVNSFVEPGQCPFCKTKFKLSKCEKLTGYGEALKRCSNCGNVYLDKDIREVAILGIQKSDTKLFEWGNLFMLLVGIVLTVVLILSVLYSPVILRITAVGPILIVASIFMMIKGVFKGIKKRALLEEELYFSKKRISNPEYMKALREKGYQIYGVKREQ